MVQITLEAARHNVKKTMKDVGKEVGVHSQTISKYEKDSSNIPFSLLRKLSSIYKIPIDNIFLGSSSRKVEQK